MEQHFGETVYLHFQGSCLIPNLIEFISLCLNMETKHLYGSIEHNCVLFSYYMFKSVAYRHKFERKLKM